MDGMVRAGTWRRDGRDGGRCRRRWPAARKAAIVAESFAFGAKVAEVAARHGVNANMLSTWRRQSVAPGRTVAAMSAQKVKRVTALPAFVPVTVCAELGTKTSASPDARPASGTIEIVVADASIRVAKGVDAATLSRVLAAVRGGR